VVEGLNPGCPPRATQRLARAAASASSCANSVFATPSFASGHGRSAGWGCGLWAGSTANSMAASTRTPLPG